MAKRAGIKNLDISEVTSLKKSRFTEIFIRENALETAGFDEWIFLPGMMFSAQDKWWGDQGKREKAHEGIDLCLYKDRRNRIHRFKENTKIPAVYAGKVVGILDDFLGKSVIIEHHFPQNNDIKFCTIFGHTEPHAGIHAGRIVKEKDIIATLADTSRSKSNIFPHLHISIGLTSGSISFEELDWESIGDSNTLALFDPLQVIDGHYSVVERDLPL